MRNIYILIILILLANCNNSPDYTNAEVIKRTNNEPKIETSESPKEWLKRNIEEYYKNDHSIMADITTERYAEYKQDAMGVEYDGLTFEQFKDKWDTIYDITYAGIGSSFLIGQQDNGVIKVNKCELLETDNENIYVFAVEIVDTTYNLKHEKEIKILKTKQKGYRIDDIK